jgi:hypothetical protein
MLYVKIFFLAILAFLDPEPCLKERRLDLAERHTAIAKVATVLGSILVASSDTEEYEGRQMLQCE